MKKRKSVLSASDKYIVKSAKNIPDSKIDFSDIPEMTLEEIKRGRRVSNPMSGKDLLSNEDFSKTSIKEKVSIWIDENVLNAFKERAKQNKSDYQDLINQTLKDAIKK